MNSTLWYRAIFLAVFVCFLTSCGNVSANLQPQSDPPASPQQTHAGQVGQVFTLATSDPATYSNPQGAFQPMPETSLNVQTQSSGFLLVSFSARGTVQPSGSQIIPIVFIECQVDGQPCQPDTNSVEFLYPQFCCDTRSFHWVSQNVSEGEHTVQILWGMGNPTSAVVTNRSLIVETAGQ